MKTILLIEDSDLARERTAALLARAGYTVLTAPNGPAGVAQALATRPDLVVCALLRPVPDGPDARQLFGQRPGLAGVPFLLLAAPVGAAGPRPGPAPDANDFLSPPYEEAALLRAVRHRLAGAGAPGPAGPAPVADEDAAGHLAALAAGRKPHTLRRKQELYAEGDEATRLYFVQRGRVKTLRRTPAGKELITDVYGSGEFFGYLPLLEQRPHADAAVVLEDAVLLYIPAEDFAQLLHRCPAVGEEFVRRLAGRVNEREQQLLAMAYDSLRRRVATALLRLHAQDPGAPIRLSRDDLAAVVGVAPESLIRTLSEFRHDGLLEQAGHGIRVVRPDKLRQPNW